MDTRLEALKSDPRFTRVPQETKEAIINALRIPDAKSEHPVTQAELNEAMRYLLAQHAGKNDQADQLIIKSPDRSVASDAFSFSRNDKFLLYWLALNQSSHSYGSSVGGGGGCGDGEGCVVIAAAACACAAGTACVCANHEIWNTQETTSAKVKKTVASTLIGLAAFVISLYEFVKHDQWKNTWDEWGNHRWSDAGYFACLALIAATIGCAAGAVTAAASLAIPCETKPEPELSDKAKLALGALAPVRDLLNKGWSKKISDITTPKDAAFITNSTVLAAETQRLQAQHQQEASEEIIRFVRAAINLYIQSIARPEHDSVLHVGSSSAATSASTPLLATATTPRSLTSISTSSFATFAPAKSAPPASDSTRYVALPAPLDESKSPAPSFAGKH